MAEGTGASARCEAKRLAEEGARRSDATVDRQLADYAAERAALVSRMEAAHLKAREAGEGTAEGTAAAAEAALCAASVEALDARARDLERARPRLAAMTATAAGKRPSRRPWPGITPPRYPEQLQWEDP
jgi:hypothetical protein